jgi:phosphoacetylglucosamine mutase
MSKNSLPHGIMITASHNPYQDNGIKISGDFGVMITPEEEDIAVEIANSKNLKETLLSVIKKLNITQTRSIIVLAHDTRRSSPKLANLMKQALDVLHCEYHFYDIVTTPCLQFLNLISILAFEKIGIKNKMIFPPVQDYWDFLAKAYKDYNSFFAEHFCEPNRVLKNYDRELCIDCSCGIAAVVKDNIQKIMESNTDLKISFINFDTSVIENLNAGCGAENTQKMKEYPLNKNQNSIVKNLSFDGDVDRVVYYKFDPKVTKNIPLIDGDRILVMYGTIINYFISLLSENLQNKFHELISIGLVITSNANG